MGACVNKGTTDPPKRKEPASGGAKQKGPEINIIAPTPTPRTTVEGVTTHAASTEPQQQPHTQPHSGVHKDDLVIETPTTSSEDNSRSDSAASVKETGKVNKGTDAEGNKTINQYVVVAPLGEGSYGKVKLVIHTGTDEAYAVKILNKSLLGRVKKGDKSALVDVQTEIAIMKALIHPSIVRLFEVIDDPTNDKLYIVMEYVEKGPIAEITPEDKINRDPIPIETLRRYTREICSGLNFLHENRIIHRDIKPENILLDSDDKPKLTDFGVSHSFEDEDLLENGEGTPAFLSPESCNAGKSSGRLNDIWALGVSLYALAYGKLPFVGDNVTAITQSIINDEPPFDETLSPQLADLLRGMLHKDPGKRLHMKDILTHPFLTNDGKQHVDVKVEAVTVNTHDVEEAFKVGHNIQMKDQMAMLTNIKGKMNKFKNKALLQKFGGSTESAGSGGSGGGSA